MTNLLSIHTIFFTVLGYPMSYIEFVGTALYLWSVWLISRRSMLTWPVGIISVLLYMALFYQIRLYSDSLEQVYYLGASVYGWWYWKGSLRENHTVLDMTYGSGRELITWLVVTITASVALGELMSRVHRWVPGLFPEAASYPYLDALTTVMSFVAMWLMARKHIESWLYWIVVDIIGIWLYYAKNVKFISLLYTILLVLAIIGFVNWRNATPRHHGKRGDKAPKSLPDLKRLFFLSVAIFSDLF
jgi:nicotinamide mononucleotide transporter